MLAERAVGGRRQINPVELSRPGRQWHGQCKFQRPVLAMLEAAIRACRASRREGRAVLRRGEGHEWAPDEADRAVLERELERKAQGCFAAPLACDP